MAHEGGHHLFSFAHHDIVDKGKSPEVFHPHLAVVVRPAEDDLHLWIQIFDHLRQSQARHILIERRGKADEFVLTPINRRHRPGQKLRRRPRRHVFKKGDRMPALPSHLLEDRLKDPGVFRTLGIVAKQKIGKEPLPEEGALLADHFIERDTDLVRETDVQVVAVNRDTFRLEQGRQSPELDRGVLRITERHVDERHLRLIAHRLPRPFIMARSPGLGYCRSEWLELPVGFRR